MGLLFVQVLPQDDGAAVLKCRLCRVDAAYEGDILSEGFQGRYGGAYLIHRVVNISLGPKEDRYFTTGLHTVNDIYCSSCQQILGWRYEKAYEESQKYKEGKFILERTMLGDEVQQDLTL